MDAPNLFAYFLSEFIGHLNYALEHGLPTNIVQQMFKDALDNVHEIIFQHELQRGTFTSGYSPAA